MIELMRNGGFPMFFILAFGATALGAAIRFAMRPTEPGLQLAKEMVRATRYASIVGLFADLTAVSFAMVKLLEGKQSDQLVMLLFQGLGESTSPIILGYTFVALASIFTAVGARRRVYD